jgi:phosphoglycolate phosphatase-like HAD superfamily hydrolase
MPARNHTLRERVAMSSRKYRAVFFDVDGVLLDSLPQHLAICRDKAREYGLPIEIPDVPAFRRMVAAGTKVSPMFEFFRAVGFPENFAQQAVVAYEREFMQRYHPHPFAGIDRMLKRLDESGHALGLVTANTAANVEPALSEVLFRFDPRCRFYFDTSTQSRSKAWCLSEGARTLGLAAENCVFIGDQPADAAAARSAKWDFLGVSYGWGLLKDDSAALLVDSPEEVADAILRP